MSPKRRTLWGTPGVRISAGQQDIAFARAVKQDFAHFCRILRYAKRCRKGMIKRFFLCATALLISTLVQAQPTSSSPDPKGGAEMTGTVKEYTPGTALVLETLAPSEPVQFKLSKTVTYAGADGKPLEAAGLKTNQKVRVQYTKVGGDNIADKISLIGN